jgi:UrcA family protein
MHRTGLFLGAVLTLGLLGLTANAEPSPDKRIDVIGSPSAERSFVILKVVVHYDDLDAGTPQGAAALLDRIHNAAIHVCVINRLTPALIAKSEKCIDKAVLDAVKKLGTPEVTHAWEAHR